MLSRPLVLVENFELATLMSLPNLPYTSTFEESKASKVPWKHLSLCGFPLGLLKGFLAPRSAKLGSTNHSDSKPEPNTSTKKARRVPDWHGTQTLTFAEATFWRLSLWVPNPKDLNPQVPFASPHHMIVASSWEEHPLLWGSHAKAAVYSWVDQANYVQVF